MECLTPPLDSVPVEEWFCPECQASSRHSGNVGSHWHSWLGMNVKLPFFISLLTQLVTDKGCNIAQKY